MQEIWIRMKIYKSEIRILLIDNKFQSLLDHFILLRALS